MQIWECRAREGPHSLRGGRDSVLSISAGRWISTRVHQHHWLVCCILVSMGVIIRCRVIAHHTCSCPCICLGVHGVLRDPSRSTGSVTYQLRSSVEPCHQAEPMEQPLAAQCFALDLEQTWILHADASFLASSTCYCLVEYPAFAPYMDISILEGIGQPS